MVDMCLFVCADCKKKKQEHLFCAMTEKGEDLFCPYCGKKGVHSFEE